MSEPYISAAVFLGNVETKKILLKKIPEKASDLIVEVFKKCGYDSSKFNVQDMKYYFEPEKEFFSVDLPYEEQKVESQKYQIILAYIKERDSMYKQEEKILDAKFHQGEVSSIHENEMNRNINTPIVPNSRAKNEVHQYPANPEFCEHRPEGDMNRHVINPDQYCSQPENRENFTITPDQNYYQPEFENFHSPVDSNQHRNMSGHDMHLHNINSNQSHNKIGHETNLPITNPNPHTHTLEKDMHLFNNNTNRPLYPNINEDSRFVITDSNKAQMQSSHKSMIPEPNDSHWIKRDAFGRLHSIGALYNVRNDQFYDTNVSPSGFPLTMLTYNNNLTEYSSKIVCGNSFQDLFNISNLEDELKVSYIANMLKPKGYAQFLIFQATSGSKFTATQIFSFPTIREFLRLSDPFFVENFSNEHVNMEPEATHIVVGVIYGGRFALTINYNGNELTTLQEAGKLLQAKECDKNESKFSYMVNHDLHENVEETTNSLALVNSSQSQIKQKIEPDRTFNDITEVNNFYLDFLVMVASLNEGKGVPIKYFLLPISYVNNFVHLNTSNDRSFADIDASIIAALLNLYDNLVAPCLEVDKLLKKFTEYSYCISDKTINDLENKLELLHQEQLKIQENIKQLALAIRYKTIVDIKMQEIMVNSYQQEAQAYKTSIIKYLNDFRKEHEKIKYAMFLDSNEITYVGKGKLLDSELIKSKIQECFICFCDSNEGNFKETQDTFNYLITQHKQITKLLYVDLEVSKLGQLEGVPPGNRICHFKNSQFIETDMVSIIKNEKSHCFAAAKKPKYKKPTQENAPPKKRINIEIPCPNSKSCSKMDKFWYCVYCKQPLEYGFDGNFYCICGYAPAYKYSFICNDENHGELWIRYDENKLKKILANLNPYEDLNILVLGETGVGKSTWVNAFANYLSYNTLEEAKSSPLICVIPCSFSVVGKNKLGELVENKVTIRDPKNSTNENTKQPEASCTQDPMAHVFRVGKSTVRVIDTPGIGDTRGLDKDIENFQKILRYISALDKINGICILLKPNIARLTAGFEYCFMELLSYLHKSAAKNIAFCFTSSAMCGYLPQDTFACLKKLLLSLKTNRGIDIPLTNSTVYGMDNEAFRVLCSHHDNKPYDCKYGNPEDFWNHSSKETKRLIEYFKGIPSHQTQEMIGLNEARRIITIIARPLADIRQTVQMNLKKIEIETDRLKHIDLKSAKLKDVLNINLTEFTMVRTPLNYPQTVCGAKKCIEIKSPASGSTSTVTLYKTICHDHCYVSEVPEEQKNVGVLRGCLCIGKNGKCTNCKCGYEEHLHITYKQEWVETKVQMTRNKKAEDDLNNEMNTKRQVEETIRCLINRKAQYEDELEIITEISAKFAHFLELKAIVAYNDALEGYIIFNKKQAANRGDTDQELFLDAQLKAYQEKKKIISEAIKNASGGEDITPGDIKKMKENLFALTLTGKQIEEGFNAETSGLKGQFEYTENFFEPALSLGPRTKNDSSILRKSFEAVASTENERTSTPLTTEQAYSMEKHIDAHHDRHAASTTVGVFSGFRKYFSFSRH